MERVIGTVQNVLKSLTTWVIIYAVLGLGIGAVLNLYIDVDDRVLMYVGFLGEVFTRLVKCFAVPLLAAFLIVTIGGFDCNVSKRVVCQFMWLMFFFTLEAVVLSMAAATIIIPGDCLACARGFFPRDRRNITIIDQYLDILRNTFPDNILLVFTSVYRTTLVPTAEWQNPKYLNNWAIKGGTIELLNILGLISISFAVGIAMKLIGEQKAAFIEFINCIFSVCLIILRCIALVSPLGIISLVAENVLHCSILEALKGIGCYTLTFSIVYAIQMLIIYPIIYMIIIRKNILNVYHLLPWVNRNCMTSRFSVISGTIAHLESVGHERNLVNFVILFGFNVNKCGAAVVMPIAALFVAQKNKLPFGVAEYTICGILAIIISTATPPIPLGTLLLTVPVLYAFDFPMWDMGIFFSVEWLRQRLEMLNNFVVNCIIVSIIDMMNKNKPDKILDQKTKDEIQRQKEEEQRRLAEEAEEEEAEP